MTTAHTPGPWRTRRGFGRDVETESGITIAFASDRDVSERRARSNARLIAAAPALLATLKELRDSAAYWSEYDVPVGIVERINAAIDRAEGRA